jgi:hypothetical protein
MGSGDDAIGVGLNIVIYLNVPSLGHTICAMSGEFLC